MKRETKCLAFDFGASSGRAIIGTFNGEKIELEEIHRFSNDPVIVNNTMYWDVLRLLYEIKTALLKVKDEEIDCIGIDTWGVDFALLNEEGSLIENPVHYRDKRTNNILDKAFSIIDKEKLYKLTGNQFMEINTAFQLLYLSLNRHELLQSADTILMIPDLFLYFLTNEKICETSIASTTQLLNTKTKQFEDEVFQKFKIPKKLFKEVTKTGKVVGKLSDSIQDELGIKAIDVAAVAGHDTQCALAGTPAKSDDFIFLSCGTWSLFGTELDSPILTKEAMEANLTNEVGAEGKISFMKNIIGLWLIQESRRQYIREGKNYSFNDLESAAREAKPFKCFIDPNAPEFTPAGNIPKRVFEYCKRTGQQTPQTMGEVMRCIYESLALTYKNAYSQIKEVTGKDYSEFYIVGGGTKDEFLCGLTASACGVDVTLGPVEATVMGNIILQLIAKGKISNLKEARNIISSQARKVYAPQDVDEWNEAFERYKKVINK